MQRTGGDYGIEDVQRIWDYEIQDVQRIQDYRRLWTESVHRIAIMG